jgi:hypothetical protein
MTNLFQGLKAPTNLGKVSDVGLQIGAKWIGIVILRGNIMMY